MQKITISASSLTGLVREHNEDALLVCRQVVRDSELNTSAFLSPEDRYVVAVCDGLGGQNAGEVASMDAAMQLAHRVATLRPGQPFARVQQLLHEWIKEEHAYLMALGEEDPSMSGMGTTLVAAVVRKNKATVVNVGDSRAYGINRTGIQQISKDHSLVQMMVDRGDLTPETAKSYPGKNFITRAIGTEPMVLCDIFHWSVSRGDYLLLCSDGLSNLMDDQEILFEVVHGVNKHQCCKRLLDIAKSRGAPDNVTSVLILV